MYFDFPDGYWFEDTVQGFLIDPLFTHSYVNESVYLYRRDGVNFCGVRGRAASAPPAPKAIPPRRGGQGPPL